MHIGFRVEARGYGNDRVSCCAISKAYCSASCCFGGGRWSSLTSLRAFVKSASMTVPKYCCITRDVLCHQIVQFPQGLLQAFHPLFLDSVIAEHPGIAFAARTVKGR